MSDLEIWLVVLAGSLALPAIAIGLGLAWFPRYLARTEAEKAAADRAAFTSVGFPARDEIVQLLVNADQGTPWITFGCHEPGLGWVDSGTGVPIPGAVFGWRPHPFFPGQHRTIDVDDPLADLAYQVAALYPEEHGRAVDDTWTVERSRRVEWPAVEDDGRRTVH